MTAWATFVLKTAIAAVLFAIMVLTGVDVVGRYLFARPVSGADELIAAGMALLIFGSLPIVALRHEHINIDTAVSLLKGWQRDLQRRLVDLIGATVLAYLAWRLLALAQKMSAVGERSSLLHIPHGALAYALAVMAGVSALVTLVLVFRRR
jgi:TRAP-type C4-dicarboxylate transport system permease small subunit